MSAQRFVPFLVILCILGAVAFILFGADETQEGGEVIEEVTIGACNQCIQLRQDMDALIKKSTSTVADWDNLLGKLKSSNSEENQRETMIKTWGSQAYQDWDNRFTRWTNGAPKPNNHQEEIKALIAALSRADQLTSERLKTLNEHSQTFKNFNWLTRLDYASNFESERRALLRSAYAEWKYTALEDKVKLVSKNFPNRPEVARANTTLENQRACHRQIHNHYDMLVAGRRIKHGDDAYTPSTFPKPVFRHGQDAYKASEFSYYYNKGKLPEWQNPVWE